MPMWTLKVFAVEPATTSTRPSPLRCPTKKFGGDGPVLWPPGTDPNDPVPVPRKTPIELKPDQPKTMSGIPSPLKSPEPNPEGGVPMK